MSATAFPDLFNDAPGHLSGDATLGHTLVIQRRLPGPLERVWAYLTDSDLRRQWLAAGEMTQQPGTSFELVWRNDDLSASPAERPDGFSAESRATCEVIEVEPPSRLRYTWPGVGEVAFELKPLEGGDVLLTLTHRHLAGERLILNVCAGWHAHLDLLVARAQGRQPPSLWSTWKRLRAEYEPRVVA